MIHSYCYPIIQTRISWYYSIIHIHVQLDQTAASQDQMLIKINDHQ